MIPYLLNILEGRLDIAENPATTKAQIVKALKAMTKSLLLGEKVNAILEKSSVWAEYKDQRHDLFISSNTSSGYLTGIKYVNNFNVQYLIKYFFIRLLDYTPIIKLLNCYLAGTPVSAGYLTAGPSTTLTTGPPPVDKEDSLVNRNDSI